MPLRAIILPFLVLASASCESYRPLQLPKQVKLKPAMPASAAMNSRQDLPFARPLRSQAFDPSDGLNFSEVAILAVVNNPRLVAERKKVNVAKAQVFSAGLLPDPQFSFNADDPTGAVPALFIAYNLGLNVSLKALITRGAKIDSAKARTQKAKLDVLWLEWQAIQRARILYVQIVHQRRKLKLFRAAKALFSRRYGQSQKAYKRGDLTLNTVGTDLTALLDANTKVGQAERLITQLRLQLNSLLGLAPDVPLRLGSLPKLSMPTRAELGRALATMAKRRPDLLALQSGYRSQEAVARKAILEQFPSISIGVNRARDTSNVRTVGIGITISLPLFNANRGNIAIARATRAQLRQEYQARLDESFAQAHLLWRTGHLIKKYLAESARLLPALDTMVRRARQAYRKGDIDALSYVNMENSLLTKKSEQLDLSEALWMATIALDIALATPRGKTQSASRRNGTP